MTDIERVNKMLISLYGVHPDGRACYKLSWTSNQTEKRFGEFNEFYGHIFIRKTIGVEEVKKYPFEFQQNQWVLERLIPTVGNPELSIIVKTSYEPIWLFGIDKSTNRALRPTLDDCQMIISCITTKKIKTTQKSTDYDEEQANKKASERMEELFDSSPLDLAFISGEAIRVPSKLYPGTEIGSK